MIRKKNWWNKGQIHWWKIKVGKDKHKYGEKEEDKVGWMRMRSDWFFKKCKWKNGEEEVVKKKRIKLGGWGG